MNEVIIAAISACSAIIVAFITSFCNKKDLGKAKEAINLEVTATKDEINAEVKKYGEKTNEALKDIMRRDIVDLYYNRKDEKFLFQFERESLDKEYNGYKELNGNTFIDDLYDAMRDWEIRR